MNILILLIIAWFAWWYFNEKSLDLNKPEKPQKPKK